MEALRWLHPCNRELSMPARRPVNLDFERPSISCQHKAFSISPLLVAFQGVTPW